MKPSKRAAARKRADQAERAESYPIVEARSYGLCEAGIEGCHEKATQVHHRGRRGWPGCNEPNLLLAVCGSGNLSGCHGRVHQNPDWSRRHGFLTDRHDSSPMEPVCCPLTCEVDHR